MKLKTASPAVTHKKALDASKLYFYQDPNIVSIEDVDDDFHYRKKGIHLRVKTTNNQIIAIKVIGDNYWYTGNFFFETYKLNSKKLGFFWTTEADYIAYYFPYTDTLYILKVNELRSWFEANRHRYKKILTSVGTKGYLVKIHDVLQEVKSARKVRL